MNKVSMLHGRALLNYDWSKSGSDKTLETMARANGALSMAMEGSKAMLEALAADPNFSDIGRQSQMHAAFAKDGIKAIRAGRDALQEAGAEIERVRGEMKGAAIDRQDMAGAILRSEIRTWLRSLDDSKRAGMMNAPDVDPLMALAVQEAPAELSGVTREQRQRLQDRSALALHPEKAERIAKIEEATEALVSTLRVASLEMMNDTGHTARDIDEMLGRPTLSDELRNLITDADEAA